jgi:AcrR family transcriptional regulator
MSSSGHEPGGTREAILSAARLELAQRGYDGATIRGVARRAGVDPRLVRHYFHDKASLVDAALHSECDLDRLIASVTEGSRDELGRRLVANLIRAASSEQGPTALVAAAMGDTEASAHLAGWLRESGLARVVRSVATDDHDTRTVAVASAVLGLALLRNLVPTAPLTHVSDERLADITGPVVQRLLTDALP